VACFKYEERAFTGLLNGLDLCWQQTAQGFFRGHGLIDKELVAGNLLACDDSWITGLDLDTSGVGGTHVGSLSNQSTPKLVNVFGWVFGS